MRLGGVELTRFFSRRAVVLVLVAAALLTALVAGAAIWDSRPVSDHDLATARAQVQQQLDSPEYKKDLANCLSDPKGFFGPGADATDCAHELAPTVGSYLGRERLSLAGQRGEGGIAVIVIITVLMIIAGATYAGADWASGSMSNQMIFEPRRTRVWVVKAAAATIACAATAAVLLVAFWLSLFAVAHSRDIATSGVIQQQIWWLVGRGVALAALAGLGGYALTMLLRSTVATLALLFVYAAVGEAVLALSPVDRSGLWSLSNNVFAWIQDGVRVFDDSIVCSPGQAVCSQHYTVSLLHGAGYLGVLLVVTLAVSALVFRRRDIP